MDNYEESFTIPKLLNSLDVAELDQLGSTLENFGSALRQYKKSLTAERTFSQKEAFELAAEFQQMYWSKQFFPNNGQQVIILENDGE